MGEVHKFIIKMGAKMKEAKEKLKKQQNPFKDKGKDKIKIPLILQYTEENASCKRIQVREPEKHDEKDASERME